MIVFNTYNPRTIQTKKIINKVNIIEESKTANKKKGGNCPNQLTKENKQFLKKLKSGKGFYSINLKN